MGIDRVLRFFVEAPPLNTGFYRGRKRLHKEQVWLGQGIVQDFIATCHGKCTHNI